MCSGSKKRVTFAKLGKIPKVEKVKLVHTHLNGPTSVASFGGLHFYVTFIDESTRKLWVYFLKHKSGVFVIFK